jgi:nitrate reductase gamma subunit
VTTLLWTILPYAALLTFGLGTAWRFRHDRFSTRSYAPYAARWASPMFHTGVILVLVGHLGGLLVPKAWTRAMGIGDRAYDLLAVFVGTAAGVLTVVGLAALIARRWVRPMPAATTGNDRAMYAVLAAAVGLGMLATVRTNLLGAGYDYRETVSPWLRSALLLRPRAELMTTVPIDVQLHVMAGLALLAFWPFTRLVHAFGYLIPTRPVRAGR